VIPLYYIFVLLPKALGWLKASSRLLFICEVDKPRASAVHVVLCSCQIHDITVVDSVCRPSSQFKQIHVHRSSSSNSPLEAQEVKHMPCDQRPRRWQWDMVCKAADIVGTNGMPPSCTAIAFRREPLGRDEAQVQWRLDPGAGVGWGSNSRPWVCALVLGSPKEQPGPRTVAVGSTGPTEGGRSPFHSSRWYLVLWGHLLKRRG